MGTRLIWLWYGDKSMFTEFEDGGSRGKKSEPDVAPVLEFYPGELNPSGKNTIFRLLRYDNRLCTMRWSEYAMQKLSIQRWVSSVRLVQQRLRQGERFVDRFGLQNFKWIMLKDGPNQDNFCKTAAMSLGPQGQRRAVISVWRNVVRQVQYQHQRGRSAWPKMVLFNMETQAIPRKKCQIREDLGEIGSSPRNVAEKNGEAEHFFYWALSGFSTEDYWGNVGNVGKHTGGIFYLGDKDKCSQASTTKFTNTEYNRIKKNGKKWRECAQHQRVQSRIRHWQTVTRHQRLCIHLVNIREKSFQPQLMQLGSDDVTDPGLDVISKRSRSRWS